ncbi:hypothetical protein PybrP1_004251 [[Pythium] brassicae (nom. inval.)]|nr:hypothetical protein PybrP1_004251 [[Pythium] brassicae (nom. inval.)]
MPRNSLQLSSCVAATEARSFSFDQVFGPRATQTEIYEQIGFSGMLNSVLEGYHATVFAYGQTGSGKTFTMEGSEYEAARGGSSSSDRVLSRPKTSDLHAGSIRAGITPRVIANLFEMISAQSLSPASPGRREFVVKCSFVQIYNEQILDLFNPSHLKAAPPAPSSGRHESKRASRGDKSRPSTAGLKLRWSAAREFYVENLRVLECQTPEQVLRHFHEGVKHKVMASHRLNAASSRSHCVFTIYVESFDPSENPNDSTSAAGSEGSATRELKLSVIDNVEMIKQLYATEKAQAERVRSQGRRVEDLQYETRVLNVENQSLRDKLEVLEYLIADAYRQEAGSDIGGLGTRGSGSNNSDGPEECEEIPGYGALASSASLPRVGIAPPSAERIQALWTVTKFVLFSDCETGKQRKFKIYASLITIVDLIGKVSRERIDPVVTLGCFLLDFEMRIEITKLFSDIVKLQCFFVAHVAGRKLYRWKYPDLVSQQRSSLNSAKESDGRISNLAQFEFATGVALRECFGVVSDYDNYVYIKGTKFASPDGIYTSGFVIANGKFLIDINDLLTVFAIKLTRTRFTNVYVYVVGGNAVKQTAQLVYPETISLADLLHLNLKVLL